MVCASSMITGTFKVIQICMLPVDITSQVHLRNRYLHRMIHECVHAVVIKQLYTVTIDKKSRFLFHMYQFLYSFSPQVIKIVVL